MPKFLTADEFYRILQRELPQDVYADGAPSAFFTTADNYAFAKVMQDLGDNSSRIYENYFPQTADEKISDWEITAFNEISASGVPLQTRRDKVIAKLREEPSISLWSILTAVIGVLPPGTPVRILEWAVARSGWRLGVSRLGVDTRLGGMDSVRAILETPSEYCTHELTDDWVKQQKLAYTYEVRIFGYTMSAAEAAQVEKTLTQKEPARSRHFVYDGLSLAADGLVTAFSPAIASQYYRLKEPAVYSDSDSSSGYSGWRTPNVS